MLTDVDKLATRAQQEAALGRMDLMNSIIAFQRKDHKAVIHFGQRSLSNPASAEEMVVYHMLSHSFAELQQEEEALRAMRKAWELAPSDYETWRAVMSMELTGALERGSIQEAQAVLTRHMERAREAGNRDIEFWALVGQSEAYSKSGMDSEALEAYRKALKLRLKDKSAKFKALAVGITVAKEDEDFEECARLAAAAIKLSEDPELAQSPNAFYMIRAHALFAVGRLEEAMEAAKKLTELEPQNLDALEFFTSVCLQLDRKKEALQAQERIRKLQPESDTSQRRDICAKILASLEASRIDVD